MHSCARAEPVRRGAASAGAQADAFGDRSADARGRQNSARSGGRGVGEEGSETARLLEEHGEEILGVYALPEAHRRENSIYRRWCRKYNLLSSMLKHWKEVECVAWATAVCAVQMSRVLIGDGVSHQVQYLRYIVASFTGK